MYKTFVPLLLSSHDPGLISEWQVWWTALLSIGLLILLIKELFSPALTMLVGAGSLVLTGVISPLEFASGFVQQVLFILAFLFIVVRALEVNGVLNIVLRFFYPKGKQYPLQILSIMAPVGLVSAVLNNTPLVLLLTPILQKWAKTNKRFITKYLIPLSYAAILGGSCTLIGTSTNLVVNDLLGHYSEEKLGFFEIGKVGIFALLIGTLYVSFFGNRLLPERKDLREELEENPERETKEFIVEESSPLVGKTLADCSALYFEGEVVVELERQGKARYSPNPDEKIEGGDRLVFMGEVEDIARLHSLPGMHSATDPHFDMSGMTPHIIEAVITRESSLVGKNLKEVDFRNRYGGLVLRVMRKGGEQAISGELMKCLVLRPGDTLLILTAQGETLRNTAPDRSDLCLIRERRQLPVFSKRKAGLSIATLVLMVVLSMMGIPLVYTGLGAVMFLLLSRCISSVEVQNSMRWGLLVLIGSAYSLALAIEKTGIASNIAHLLAPILQMSPYLFVAGTFLLVAVVTEMITNTAAVLILFPILVQIGRYAGFDSPSALKAIAVTAAIAGSCSLCSPIGYQTNTIVYGAGNYRFLDFAKVGAPLTLILMALCTWLVPTFWSLS